MSLTHPELPQTSAPILLSGAGYAADPDAAQPIDFPDDVCELRRLYPELAHWTDGMIEVWWSDFEVGMGVKKTEPQHSHFALALALHDHLAPGLPAYDYNFESDFFAWANAATERYPFAVQAQD